MKIYRAGAIGDTGHADAEGNYLGFDMGHGLHLPYQFLPNVEMVAVADPDAAARERGMRDTGAQRSYADYRDMLAKERLDVVSVCSRQAVRHEAMILAAVEAGCHVFVDKPFTTDLASADRIVAACDRRGVKLAIAYQSRYIEPFLTAQAMVKRGEIGRLLSMHGRVKEDHRGGGEDVICCGVHITDVMRMFAGDPEWVFGTVTQNGRPVTLADAHEPADRNGLVAGDASDAMYGFADGVVGYLTSVRNQHLRGERWGITLVGTEATLSLRFFNDNCSMSKLKISRSAQVPEEGGDFVVLDIAPEPVPPGSPALDTGYPPARGNRQAVWDLLKAAEEGREPLASGRDGRWSLEMALGIYASHLAGKRLTLPLAERRHPLGETVHARERQVA
ncbi:MAG TPA: Gfo/Idh/MocA family oxidoreductase [Devosiaceae bacterium]